MANILDPAMNFAIATLGAIDIDDETASVGAGEGAKFPAPATVGAFNVVLFNSTDYRNPSDDPDKEIIRITARSTDALTFTRAQEGTSAATHNTAGKVYKIILGYTGKIRDDIERVIGIDGLTAKTTEPADADMFGLMNSEVSNSIYKISWLKIKGWISLINHPVGCVYIAVASTSPATLFGGTWAVFGAGKALVGLDSADTDFDTAEETRGEKTHTLTTDEMPVHAHNQYNHVLQDNDTGGTQRYHVNTGSQIASGNAGGGDPHNNIQPSIVVYMWKRTA